MGVCNCSMFCCTLLYVHSSIAIILMGKRELIALLNLSSWCLVIVERLFLTVPRGCLQFVIVVFSDHTHLLFIIDTLYSGSLRIKNSIFFTSNCTFYKWCVSKVAHYMTIKQYKTFVYMVYKTRKCPKERVIYPTP